MPQYLAVATVYGGNTEQLRTTARHSTTSQEWNGGNLCRLAEIYPGPGPGRISLLPGIFVCVCWRQKIKRIESGELSTNNEEDLDWTNNSIERRFFFKKKEQTMTNYDNSGKPKSPAAGVDRDGISTGDTARCMAIAMLSEQALVAACRNPGTVQCCCAPVTCPPFHGCKKEVGAVQCSAVHATCQLHKAHLLCLLRRPRP